MNYQDMFKNVNVESLVGPVRRYNELLVDNAEKLLSMQLDAARSYTDLGIKQIRDAMEVNDVKTLQDYLSNQSEVAKTVAERAQQDARGLAELGQSFASELQGLVQENVASAAGQGKAAKSKAVGATTTSSGAS